MSSRKSDGSIKVPFHDSSTGPVRMDTATNAAGLNRRDFVKVCSAAAAAVTASPGLLAASAAPIRSYGRSRLVNVDGDAFKAADIPVGQTFVFRYPFTETPCFLVNLGERAAPGEALTTGDGDTYTWQGGSGPHGSIVSFSAICSHKLSHPAKTISFINYQHQKVNFSDHNNTPRSQESVIFCCSERSVYDPRKGGRVLGGPAPQPLAAIALDYDSKTDSLYATGTHGGEMFDAFFAKFGPRLMLEQATSDIRLDSPADVTVQTIESYTRTLRACG